MLSKNQTKAIIGREKLVMENLENIPPNRSYPK